MELLVMKKIFIGTCILLLLSGFLYLINLYLYPPQKNIELIMKNVERKSDNLDDFRRERLNREPQEINEKLNSIEFKNGRTGSMLGSGSQIVKLKKSWYSINREYVLGVSNYYIDNFAKPRWAIVSEDEIDRALILCIEKSNIVFKFNHLKSMLKKYADWNEWNVVKDARYQEEVNLTRKKLNSELKDVFTDLKEKIALSKNERGLLIYIDKIKPYILTLKEFKSK